MERENLKPRFEELISEKQIQQKVKELAQEIYSDYKGKNLLLVGILKGSFVFMSDLLRELDELGMDDVEVDFLVISSYKDKRTSSRDPKILLDLHTNINDREVLVVEDIIDTGHSIDKLLEILKTRTPASFEVCSLLSKPGNREVKNLPPVKYIGFEIEDVWVEGYGLDSSQRGRGRKNIVARFEDQAASSFIS